jgi:hypothetical protein
MYVPAMYTMTSCAQNLTFQVRKAFPQLCKAMTDRNIILPTRKVEKD